MIFWVFIAFFAFFYILILDLSPVFFNIDLFFIFFFQCIVYTPQLLPFPSILALGTFYDILSFGTLGVHGLLLIALKYIVDYQKNYLFFKDFYYIWGIFIIFFISKTIATSFFYRDFSSMTFLFTILFYPLSAKIFQSISYFFQEKYQIKTIK